MTHFRTLGLGNTASAADIRRAYHRLAQELHPDLAAGLAVDAARAARFAEATAAYNALKTPALLEAYRKSLFGESTVGPSDAPIIEPLLSEILDEPRLRRLSLGLRCLSPQGLQPGNLAVRVPVYDRSGKTLIRRGSKVLSFRIAREIPVGQVQDYPPMPLFPIVEGEAWALRIVVLPADGPIPPELETLAAGGVALPGIAGGDPAGASNGGIIRRWLGRR